MIIKSTRVYLLQSDEIAEVREPKTGELIEHMWVPRPSIDLTAYVTKIELRPEKK